MGGGNAWPYGQSSGPGRRGYSGSWYAGNIKGDRNAGQINALSGDDTYYLYHGKFQTQYGVFYLSNYGITHNISFIYYKDPNRDKYCISENKITVITDKYYRFADIVSHNEYAMYFDVMPESWLNWLLQQSFTSPSRYYNLCFVAQSDIEEFLNTYWKYEGGN